MTLAALVNNIRRKNSFLCVGLDPDLDRIPKHLGKSADSVLAFNLAIIDATKDLCVAYKPNLAFYESLGKEGWDVLAKTLAHIPDDILVIADAKRGDIGNTSKQYAEAFFKTYGFDAVTIAPYMGEDSVKPFLSFPGHWAIILAVTSNQGGQDFQRLEDAQGIPLFKHVIQKCTTWGTPDNLMFVCGATYPDELAQVRQMAPEHFILVPGIGSQGGDFDTVCQAGITDDIGLLINSSRGILYAGQQEDYAEKARESAQKLVLQMKKYM